MQRIPTVLMSSPPRYYTSIPPDDTFRKLIPLGGLFGLAVSGNDVLTGLENEVTSGVRVLEGFDESHRSYLSTRWS